MQAKEYHAGRLRSRGAFDACVGGAFALWLIRAEALRNVDAAIHHNTDGFVELRHEPGLDDVARGSQGQGRFRHFGIGVAGDED